MVGLMSDQSLVGGVPSQPAQPTKPFRPGERGEHVSRLFTPQVSSRILTVLQQGLTLRDAAVAGAVSMTQVRQWIRWGHEAAEGDEQFVEFAQKVDEAVLAYKLRNMKTINAAIERGDAKLALDVMARRFPNEWGVKTKVDIAGDPDNPPIVVLSFPSSTMSITDAEGEDVVDAVVVDAELVEAPESNGDTATAPASDTGEGVALEGPVQGGGVREALG